MRIGYSKRLFCRVAVAVAVVAAAATAQERPASTPQTAPKRAGSGGGVAGGLAAPAQDGIGGGGGAGPAAQKSKLEEMLEKALKNNPDLRVAVTKAQEAEAELNRTRLEVTRKVVRAHATLDAAKTNVAAAQQRLEDVRKLLARQAVGKEELQAAEKDLAAAKTDLATAEGEALYLLGEPTWNLTHVTYVTGNASEGITYNFGFPSSGERRSALQQAETYLGALRAVGVKVSDSAAAAATNMRGYLDEGTTVNFKDVPLTKVLEDLNQSNGNVHFVLRLDGENPKVTMTLVDVPLGAVFQAITDVVGVRFIVRDYGILVVGTKQALPADAVTAHEYWKARPAGDLS
jgi:hypothetical protein